MLRVELSSLDLLRPAGEKAEGEAPAGPNHVRPGSRRTAAGSVSKQYCLVLNKHLEAVGYILGNCHRTQILILQDGRRESNDRAHSLLSPNGGQVPEYHKTSSQPLPSGEC